MSHKAADRSAGMTASKSIPLVATEPLHLDGTALLHLFRIITTAREIDRRERELVGRREAFFHVRGAGHEGSAVLAGHLIRQD
jgi:hypothetical protein